jgi:SEC-C motif-containing protein
LEVDTQWKRLEIISAHNDTQQGSVHFKAYYKEQDEWHLLEETSKFLFENEHWFYHSGNYQPQILKPNRNDACPCGSGKKFKKCCL